MATKKNLEIVAKELNKLLQLDPVIKTGNKATIKQLMADIDESAKLIEPSDEISEETKAVFAEIKEDLSEKAKEILVKAKILEEESEEEEEKEKEETEEKEKPEKKEKEKKKPGVILTILGTIKDAGPVNMDEILEKLKETFPERKPESMMKTIKAQIGGKKRPFRLEKEREVELKKDEQDKFTFVKNTKK